MKKVISLNEFMGKNNLTKIRAGLEFLRCNPGSTLIIPEGEYIITTPEAKAEENRVLTGEYGDNPEPVMFSPNHPYEIGLDFTGHDHSTVIANGVHFIVDGFMEVISIKDCKNVTIEGLYIDHKRKPYSKGIIKKAWREDEDNLIRIEFPSEYPVTENTPLPRIIMYNTHTNRFDYSLSVKKCRWPGEAQALEMIINGEGEKLVGNELYFTHCFHSRPAILIERASETTLKNITIHSHNGMGITAFHANNILIEGLRVIPSAGEHYSTNTDATHFSSCRGRLRLDGCQFEGQGDDSINVHTYYYTISEAKENTVRLVVKAPTFTHTQSLDYPKVGDTLELTSRETIACVKKYRVTDVALNYDCLDCTVTLDEALPEALDINDYMFADPDELPDLEFVNCNAKNHLARSILIKCRRALVENCTVTDSGLCAVKIAAESFWSEGVNCENVVIRGNRFINNCRSIEKAPGACGGIMVYMEGATKPSLTHGKVVIEDNIIENPNCDHCILLSDVREVKLARNSCRSIKEPVVIKNNEIKIL